MIRTGSGVSNRVISLSRSSSSGRSSSSSLRVKRVAEHVRAALEVRQGIYGSLRAGRAYEGAWARFQQLRVLTETLTVTCHLRRKALQRVDLRTWLLGLQIRQPRFESGCRLHLSLSRRRAGSRRSTAPNRRTRRTRVLERDRGSSVHFPIAGRDRPGLDLDRRLPDPGRAYARDRRDRAVHRPAVAELRGSARPVGDAVDAAGVRGESELPRAEHERTGDRLPLM